MNDRNVVGKNIDKEVIKVRHDELERIGDSLFKSKCSACNLGILMVRREKVSPFRLLDFDMCLLCGQAFQYVDILTMRKNEGNE